MAHSQKHNHTQDANQQDPKLDEHETRHGTTPPAHSFEIAGFPWQFVLIMSVIGLALIGLVVRIVTGF